MNTKPIWLISIIVAAVTMVVNPKAVFDASTNGFETWYKILLPSLLPFFIVANLMLKLGFVNFIGVLLDPIMRPVFNVPGSGGFVMAIGYTSGFPIGSVLSAELRKQNLCTKNEAERLMSFTNNASPLFMFGAISVGMFGKPELGIVIALGHYLANITIGIILGHLSRKGTYQSNNNSKVTFITSLSQATKSLISSRDFVPGKILSESISKSLKTILSIGGFVILFSVFIETLTILNIINFLEKIFVLFLNFFGLQANLSTALSVGLFEVTLGVKQVVQIEAPLHQQLAIAAFILGWCGLSIHAQIAGIISNTDIQMKTFVISRIFHGFFGAIYTYILWNPVQSTFSSSGKYPLILQDYLHFSWYNYLLYSFVVFITILSILLCLSFLILFLKKIIIVLKIRY